ncbi:MAG TPA: GDSL-type esterase/lipase family protein [Flavitalea sp.]|nr:GDSL-type esterase/lipase family protein [Flavitalea sp.]
MNQRLSSTRSAAIFISFCIFFFNLFVFDVTAQQTAAIDSTVRPGSFKNQLELFRSYPNSTRDIVFLGNSITAGVNWAELLGNPNAKNRGISGDITFGILERLDEVTEGKPAKIFILIGINDIQRNHPDSVIVANYYRIVHRIKTESPSTKIYFQQLMPVNNEFTQFKNHYNKDEHIRYVNDALIELGKKEKVTIIDLHTPFMNSDGKLDKKYTSDGLHVNAAGYLLWADILKKGNYLK